MAIVDQHQRAVTVGERADLLQFGDIAVHREHAVAGDELEPRARAVRFFQAILELVHVRIGEAIAFGFREPHAVDDRGVVEAVGNDRVGFVEQRLEHAAIGVETGRESDRVVLAEVLGDRLLERAMERLRAADEAHRGHAEAEFVHRPPGGGDDIGVVGEAEIIVGAEIDRLARALRRGDMDASALRTGEQPLAFCQALRLDVAEGRADMVEKNVGHRASAVQGNASIAAQRSRSNPRREGQGRGQPRQRATKTPSDGAIRRAAPDTGAVSGKDVQERFAMNGLGRGQRVAPALTRYGSTAVAFHWAVAALVVFLGTLGILFDDIPKESRPFWINIHGCVGLVYFVLVIARLGWRASHKPPDLPPDIGEFDRRFSLAAHRLLYALMVLIPIFGFVAFVWHGRAFDYGLARLNFGVASNCGVLSPRRKFISCWPIACSVWPPCTRSRRSIITSSAATASLCGCSPAGPGSAVFA